MGLEKRRDSNIELFRIITMLLIVAHHYVVNSGLTAADGPIYSDPTSWRSLFLLLFGAWGKTGINCFVMITGYFMCKSRITAKKFAKLLLEILFYRLIISTVFWISGYDAFTWRGLLLKLIPITKIGDGFNSAFLVFFLSIPFLNVLVHNLSERQHQLLLLLCGFTYTFLGTVPGFSVRMNYVSWFIVLFLVASYIRLYPKDIFRKTKLWAWLTALMLVLCCASVLVCAWLSARLGENLAYRFVSDCNTLLALLTGVCSFLFFKNLRIPFSKLINTVAASTYGVLLIHANSDTMRQWLWRDTLNNVGHYSSKWMPLHAFGSVLAVFAICTAIDLLRIQLIEKPFFQRAGFAFEKAERRLCQGLEKNAHEEQ